MTSLNLFSQLVEGYSIRDYIGGNPDIKRYSEADIATWNLPASDSADHTIWLASNSVNKVRQDGMQM